MSKICRTCLQKTNQTFKATQMLGDFGEGLVQISVVLRFCIPELYLGLSTNPEICFTCKENLVVSYLFKKKCLTTENLVGNYLKDVRCTGKSIELHDVIAYLEDEIKTNINKEKFEIGDLHQLNSLNYERLLKAGPETIAVLEQLAKKDESASTTGDSAAEEPANTNVPTTRQADTKELFKISSVYSLKDDSEGGNIDSSSVKSDNSQERIEDAGSVKEEPIDIEINDESLSFDIRSDEDTLEASETTAMENGYPTNLQDLINSIPEVHHPDQYIDMPDFVIINNFGFKELEELKSKQAQPIQQQQSSEVDVRPSPAWNTTVANESPPEIKVIDVKSKLPDILYVDGKKMVRCGHGYKTVMENVVVEKEIVIPEKPEEPLLTSPRKRKKQKIKIVPVVDEPTEKTSGIDSVPVKKPKKDDKEVVVLFTTYTRDGDYVNDHDYLMNPYKRNKVLIEENSEWVCVCYICNFKHPVRDHVRHLSGHGSRCRVCQFDLGTPFMYNIHYKTHKKPCKLCTQVVPLGQMKAHMEIHIKEEEEEREAFEPRRRTYKSRRGRRRVKGDEKTVYFSIPKKESKESESGGSQSEDYPKTAMSGDEHEIDNNHTVDLDGCSESRGHRTDPESETDMSKSPRSLRSRKKKLYTESDDEDYCITEKVSSESKGTASDLGESEK